MSAALAGFTFSEQQTIRQQAARHKLPVEAVANNLREIRKNRVSPARQSFVATESAALTAAEETHVRELASRNGLDAALVRESYVASTRERGGARFVEPQAAAFTESPGVTFDDRRLGNRALDTLQASEGVSLTAQERENVIGLAKRNNQSVTDLARNFSRSKASRR